MSLSSDLVSEFVKITKDSKDTKKESIAYGTIVEYNGSKYVKLDGSDLLTPISSTTNVEADERVTVMIKNHTATVTGNISSPAARTAEVETIGSKISEFEVVIADKVDTKEFNSAIGRIDELQSDNIIIKETLTANSADITNLETDNATIKDRLTANEASITDLEAVNATITGRLDASDADIDSLQADNILVKQSLTAAEADIDSLQADNVIINQTLVANSASIKSLETNKLSATDADLKYANIDFTNIGTAAIEKFFSKSGMIDELVVGEGTIAGKLVGVTIVGDLIEGGTVKADKLVVLGTDGLYYKLNTNGVTTETEQTDYNSLNGSIITAQSITATKIAVDDLVAFDATIGGFNITDNSIYSGAKESVSNTTRGIYLDNDGQIAFGDSNQYVKFYKDTNDNQYKLSIQANAITFGASNKDIETSITDIASDINDNYATKEEVNNIEIIGRNYLQRSDIVEYFSDWIPFGSASLSLTNDYLTITTPSNQNTTGAYPIMVSTLKAGTYTASFDAYVDSTSTLDLSYLCLMLGENNNIRITNGTDPLYVTINSEETRYSFEFTITNDCVNCSFMIGAYVNEGTTIPTYHIRNVKIEKGNRATEWTEAPEDIRYSITKLQQTSSELKASITSISNDLDETDSRLSNDVSAITKYVSFNIDGLTIGKEENPYKVIIDNDEFKMTETISNVDTTVMNIKNGIVNTPQVKITNGFNLLGFSFVIDANGNLNCEYVGQGE